MNNILEFDINRIKEKLPTCTFIIIFEVIYLITVTFATALDISSAYAISVAMNTILVAVIIFILTICTEDFKYELIYDKLKYHPMKPMDFYRSKLIIMSVFAIFQTLITIICFVLGHLMLFKPITISTILPPLVITCITILAASVTVIIFCGKSLYSIVLAFIPSVIIIINIDFIFNLI